MCIPELIELIELIEFILLDKQTAYIRCKSKGLLNQILELTNFLDNHYDSIPWKQRFRHIIDQKFELETCVVCGNPAKLGYSDIYTKTCSPKCDKIYRKNIFKEKYGVDNYSKTKEFKDKLISSNNSNFGVNNPMQSNDIQNKHKKNYIKKVKEKLGDEYELISYGKTLRFLHKKCGNETEILRDTFNKRHNVYKTTHCVHCNPFYSQTSEIEKDFAGFIQSRSPYTTRTCVRDIIIPYELDIYIPELKMAIEFNGDYFHSSIRKNEGYHKMKSDLCEKQGIKLLHIWEHEWINDNKNVSDIILWNIQNKDLTDDIINNDIKGISKNGSVIYINRDYYDITDINKLIKIGFKLIDFRLDYWYHKNNCNILTKDHEPNVPSGYHRCFNSGVYELVWNK